jgi:hypothetical protein
MSVPSLDTILSLFHPSHIPQPVSSKSILMFSSNLILKLPSGHFQEASQSNSDCIFIVPLLSAHNAYYNIPHFTVLILGNLYNEQLLPYLLLKKGEDAAFVPDSYVAFPIQHLKLPTSFTLL